MTHILSNPGFPHNMKFRSKSADVFRAHERRKEGISKTEFEKIRAMSRQSWNEDYELPGNPLPRVGSNHFVSTYSTNHNYRVLDEYTPTRPTSPSRRNNPHPTRAFLHQRLREAPGFQKPKVKPDQDPYQVGYRPDKEPINTQRTMYYTLWEMKDLQKRGADEALKAVMRPNEVPTTRAWIKNASVKDRRIVEDLLHYSNQHKQIEQGVRTTFKPDVVPAVNRWLKQAGREEQASVMRLIKTLSSDPYKDGYIDTRMTGQLNPNRYILGAFGSCTERYKPKPRVSVHRPYRTDLTMHPECLTA